MVIPRDPHREAWKTLSYHEAQEQIRTFRVEQGREAVRNSTKQERNAVISKFNSKVDVPHTDIPQQEGTLSLRVGAQETQEVQSATPIGATINSTATVPHGEATNTPPIPRSSDSIDEEEYERQLERALQLSLEDCRKQDGALVRYGSLNTANRTG